MDPKIEIGEFTTEKRIKLNFDEAVLCEVFLKEALESVDEIIAKAKSQDDREYILRDILLNFEALSPEVQKKYKRQVVDAIEKFFPIPDEVISFASKAHIHDKAEGKLLLMSYIKNLNDTNLAYIAIQKGFIAGILENSDLHFEK